MTIIYIALIFWLLILSLTNIYITLIFWLLILSHMFAFYYGQKVGIKKLSNKLNDSLKK